MCKNKNTFIIFSVLTIFLITSCGYANYSMRKTNFLERNENITKNNIHGSGSEF